MPVASNTRPLYFSPSTAVVVLAMPRASSEAVTGSARRPVPPVTTVPSTRGAPSCHRSSATGSGRPRFLTSSLPSGLDVKEA